MISRQITVLAVAILGASLFAPAAAAQARGMRVPVGTPRARSSFRLNGTEGFARHSHRLFSNRSGFLFFPYFYPEDEFDSAPVTQVPAPIPEVVAQPAQTSAPAAPPAETLLLESRGGQWVRIPTGSQMAILQSSKPDAVPASSLLPGIAGADVAAPPPPELPPAVIVFRDGHVEELGKYVIDGAILSTAADNWSTGSWTRKIPLTDLDIPASLKLNKDRGTKFRLPSGPNEVVVRF